MDYTNIKVGTPEFKSLFGGLVDRLNLIDQYEGRYNSLIQYISGIKTFDDFLSGVKFANTDLLHGIVLWEKGISFSLQGENIETLFFVLLREDIESIVAYHEQDIELLYVNKTLNVMKTGLGLGGLIPALTAKAAGNIGSAIVEKFGSKKSIIEKGSIYEIRTKLLDNESHTIKVSCRDMYKNDVNNFFDSIVNFKLSANNKSEVCFVATVCYEDPFATEVVAFRAFRDNIMQNSFLGRLFIRLYYSVSPSLANRLYSKRGLVKLIKNYLLNPIYNVIKHSKNER